MQPNNIGISLHHVLPETITAVVALVIMMVDAISRNIERRIAGAISLLGLAGAGAAVISLWNHDGETSYGGMIPYISYSHVPDRADFFAMGQRRKLTSRRVFCAADVCHHGHALYVCGKRSGDDLSRT
jgi:hypothetical protein